MFLNFSKCQVSATSATKITFFGLKLQFALIFSLKKMNFNWIFDITLSLKLFNFKKYRVFFVALVALTWHLVGAILALKNIGIYTCKKYFKINLHIKFYIFIFD